MSPRRPGLAGGALPTIGRRRLTAVLGSASAARVAAGVGALGTLALILLDSLVRDERVPRGDDLIYERMAQDPFAPHTFPFAYRILTPTIVHVLPFSHRVSFSLIGWLASGTAAGFMFLLLERLGVPRGLAVALALLFAISPPLLVASLREGRNPDPVTALVMCAGTYFIVRRNPPALAVTMLLGALNRESALFLAPLAYACWAERPWSPRALGDVALVSAPAIAAFAALRVGIPTVGREQVRGYDSLLAGRWELIEDGVGGLAVQARRIGYVAGPLWIFAALALRDSPFARRGLVLIGLCLVAMTFAGDWGRIAFIAAPVVYGAGALALAPRRRWWLPVLGTMLLINLGYAVHMDRSGVRNGIIDAPDPAYPVR